MKEILFWTWGGRKVVKIKSAYEVVSLVLEMCGSEDGSMKEFKQCCLIAGSLSFGCQLKQAMLYLE